jgi:hypothetical protein
MIIDAQCLLSDAQAVVADAVSTNNYDSGGAGNDITEGEPLGIGITVDVAADHTTGDETYTFEAIEDDDAALGSPVILNSRTILAADLAVGSRHILPIPPGSKRLRYLGINYNVGGTTPTITVTAFIAPLSFLGGWKAHAKGYTVQA